MPVPDNNLLQRLLATFKGEAREHIDAIAAGLMELERTTTADAQATVLDATFRAAHSLKGAARTVNVRDIEALCHSLESVFAILRRKELALSAELFDLLHRAVAMLGVLLQATDAGAAGAERPSIVELMQALRSVPSQIGRDPIGHDVESRVLHAPMTASVPDRPAHDLVAATMIAAPPGRRHGSDTIRVSTAKLDSVLLQAEELLSAKLATAQQSVRLHRCRVEPVEWKKRWMKLRPDVSGLRQVLERSKTVQPQLLRVMDFLDWSRDCMESLDSKLLEVLKAADHDQRSVGSMVDNLLDEMKKVVMQPFSTLLDVLPSMVRELSREQGKAVELAIHGEDIEIDRRILEEMKDPLIQLVRNCIDHGIEKPEARARAAKPLQGTLTISTVAIDGNNVELTLRDDGGGIDAVVVKASAVKQQELSAEAAAALGDQEALSLIFRSGVSTSPIITDLSGRGLGLAIVKEKVEKLNGTVAVSTELGAGTTFRIVLPLTLARFRGVLVSASEHLFVLPTNSVERVCRVGKEEIKTIENRETILVRDEVTALVRLAEVLELPVPPNAEPISRHQSVVVLAHGNQRVAFVVDAVLNEQEVLVKRLGRQLARVRNIVGATVLGTGQVVPILNVPDLVESAVHGDAGTARATAESSRKAVAKQSVLVAEDSITSRILIKNILETAGYRVETAVDGMDGLTKLRSGAFDLVVSDVEMPRMDGIGLTTQLRADKKLSQIPVILVTALDSRADRERGVDAGANAYIVKSSFDQSNLLEVVRRLI